MSRLLPIDGARWPRAQTARAWLASRSDGERLHAGVDLGRAGELVRAPEAGIVWGVIEASYAGDEPRFSRPTGWAGYGPHVVVLEGDSGAWHVLAHVDVDGLGASRPSPGQRVELGQVVALVAERGGHLHWEVRSRTKPPRGWATIEVALDPAAWLEGRTREWSRELDGCPPRPGSTAKTPRACRPGAEFVAPSPGREEAPTAPDPLAPPARPVPAAPRRTPPPDPSGARRPTQGLCSLSGGARVRARRRS